MIQLILGLKGSGKTKRLLKLVNDEVEQTKGQVVFIDDDKRYMYDVKHQVRFVDVKDYALKGTDQLYGLICGMLAQNFDISEIFIDAFLKISNCELAEAELLLKKLETLAEKSNVKMVISVSADEKDASDYIKQFII